MSVEPHQMAAGDRDTLNVWKVLDARIATSEPNKILAYEGADFVRWQTLPSQGGAGLNLSWLIQPGSPNVGIGRTIYVTMSGTTVITGTNLAAANTEVSLRNNPFHSCVTNAQLQINTSTFNLGQVNVICEPLSMYNQNALLMNGALSPTACSPDCIAGGLGSATAGSNSLGQYNSLSFDPMRPASGSVTGGYIPPTRSCAITGIVQAGGGGTSLTVSWTVREPLIIPPLVVSNSDCKSIFGVGQANLKITLDQPSLDQICVVGMKGNGTTITMLATTPGSATIELSYFTPSEDSLKTRPIGLQRYSYAELQLQQAPITLGALTPAAVPFTPVPISFELPSTTLAVVPRAFIIWATWDRTTLQPALAVGEPSWYLPINSLNITFGQRNSIFNSASQRAIWEASCKAGLVCSYPRFAGLPLVLNSGANIGASQGNWSGSPVIIRASDCSLPEGICSGANVLTLLQISGTLYNQTTQNLATNYPAADGKTPKMNVYCLIIQDGIVELDNGGSHNQLISLSLPEIAKAKTRKALSEDEVTPHINNAGFGGAGILHKGGSFWDDLYSGVKQVGATALGALPMLLGAGGASSGGRRRGGEMVGGQLIEGGAHMTGGARMSRSSIRHRLSQLD